MSYYSQNYRPLRRRREAGFTLIEIVAALFIIVVCILPITSLLLSARSLDQQAQVQAVAYNAARQEMETLRAEKFANHPVAAQAGFAIPNSLTAQFPTISLVGSYSIASVSSYGGASYPVQQIAVQVRWNNASASGTPSFVRLDTLLTQEPGR